MKVLQADPANVKAIPIDHAINDIAYTEQGIWTAGDGHATRIDPVTNKAGDPIETPALAEEIAIDAGTVWLPGTTDDGYVERIAADTGEVNTQPLEIGTQPDPVDAHGGFVWIGDEKEEVLRKVDAETGQVVGEPIDLGAFPTQGRGRPARRVRPERAPTASPGSTRPPARSSAPARSPATSATSRSTERAVDRRGQFGADEGRRWTSARRPAVRRR